MSEVKKTKVHLISGFLGTGKTTALKSLMAQKDPNEKWVIIVNEFGEIGIDGAVLSDNGIPVAEIDSFSDGNKRIATTPFLWFMNNNGILYNPDGSKRIGDNTLVALTLMIAESRTEEKDTMALARSRI